MEKCQYFDIFNILFLQPRKAFSRSRLSLKHFLGLYCLKKKLEKWPFLDQSHGKMSIFRLFEPLISIAQKGVFLFQNIVRDIFLCYIAEKEKVGKRPIVERKPWVNPFGKMSIFRFFYLVFLGGQKGVFSFQNIVKDIFLAYLA